MHNKHSKYNKHCKQSSLIQYFKTAYHKTIKFISLKFANAPSFKKVLSKCADVIRLVANKTVSTVKTAIYILVDHFKATNFYAYSKRYLKAYKNSSFGIKAVSVAALLFVILSASFICSGATIAYNINYNGEIIGTVSNKKMCVAAVRLAASEVSSDAKDEISAPKYTLVLSFKNRLASKQDLKDAILETTDSIAYASLLKVDGKAIVYVKDANLEEYLKEYRDSFNLEDSESVSDFVEKVEIQTGYFKTENIHTLEEAKEIITSSLSVKTDAVVVSEEEIPYETTKNKTSAKTLGYSEVVTEGIPGTRINTDAVLFVNGVEIERTNISSEITKEPVNEVILVGTAKNSNAAKLNSTVYASGFVFPIDKSATWEVSAYFGDGRNHKAIDLRAPHGTEIYSVAAGKVTYSGYNGDYGYLVVVDHGNGISTAYAHASQLYVKQGDAVSAGETIALVGSTGNSSGNHLHFEVRKGNTRLDPAPYIGLN